MSQDPQQKKVGDKTEKTTKTMPQDQVEIQVKAYGNKLIDDAIRKVMNEFINRSETDIYTVDSLLILISSENDDHLAVRRKLYNLLQENGYSLVTGKEPTE